MDGGAEVTGGLATVPRSRSAMKTPAPTPSSTAASTTARTRTRPEAGDRRPRRPPAERCRRRLLVGSRRSAVAAGCPTAAAGPGGSATGNGAVDAPAASGPVAGAKLGRGRHRGGGGRHGGRLARDGTGRRRHSGGGAVWLGPWSGGRSRSCPTRTDPSATSCFGWLSSASGRPNAADSISLTSGIRDEPPTSTMRRRSPGSTPADSSARRIAATVSPIAGRIMSRTRRGSAAPTVVIPGSATGTTVSTLNDSASLASTQSRRSRASPVAVAGSRSGRAPATSGPSAARTCRNTASSKSIPPSCSTPSGGPSQAEPRRRRARGRRRRRCRRPGRRRRPGRPRPPGLRDA